MRRLRNGEVIDRRYKIEGLVGAGGMGEVYRARRTRLGDVVAIKIIHSRTGEASTLTKQFLCEAQLCAMLHHPHIVSVLDFGVESSVGPYLVMELMNGSSLKQQLESDGPFEFSNVCGILSQVAAALDLAHSQGVVHRDLKPGNVMAHRYTTGEVVHKVIDFGIGALQDVKASGSTPDIASTPSGREDRVLLTLAYASPEQLSGGEATPRSDIYSLGVTVYELLTGRRPLVGSAAESLVDSALRDSPEAPARGRGNIPPAARTAILKALAHDPKSRWKSVSDFARAVGGALPLPSTAIAVSSSRLLEAYELGSLIGRGRLGSSIYEGTQRATGHAVAIRVLRRDETGRWNDARTRFLREARMTPVNHASILRVRDFGEEQDQLYVVTDFVPGRSLREEVDKTKGLPWERGRPLLADLISATRALHTRGLLAFGLTPSIIRLTSEGDRERLVMSLAGVADIREVLPRAEPARKRASINEDAFYLAPELLIGEEPDGRTDIFMIGAIGYEMFTGRRPFNARTLEQLVTVALSEDLADPRIFSPSLPVDAALCLVRCLARRPDKRFSDVIELETAWRSAQ